MTIKALLATVLLLGAPCLVFSAPIVHVLETPIWAAFTFDNPAGGLVPLDLNADGQIDLTFDYGTSGSFFETEGGNAVFSQFSPPNLNGLALPLSEGSFIGEDTNPSDSQTWFSGLSGLDSHLSFDGSASSTFNGAIAFLGVRFQAENGMHYGWVLFEDIQRLPGGRIHAWGYETVPEQGLLATAVPESAAGAYLFFGSLFVLLVVRRRQSIG